MAYPKFTTTRTSILSEIDKTVQLDDNGQRASRVISSATVGETYTNVVNPVSDTDIAAGTYRQEINPEGFSNMSLQLRGSGGVTFTVWATLDSSATTASDAGWVDVSSDILGAASLVDGEGIYFIDTNQHPLKWMVKYVTSDSTNAVDIFYRLHI